MTTVEQRRAAHPGVPMCLCGHLTTHHDAPAFEPRVCLIAGCGCAGFIDERRGSEGS